LKPSESLSNISTFSASYFMPRTLIEWVSGVYRETDRSIWYNNH
jgi:hypothetical protein